MSHVCSTEPASIADSMGLSNIDTVTKVPESNCRLCGKPTGEIFKSFENSICCDDCCEKYDREKRMEHLREYWEGFCPTLYRSTEPDHPDFARVWPLVKNYKDLKQNLILCGSTGLCKTRAAMHRLKFCVLAGHSVQVLWADELGIAVEERKTAKFFREFKSARVLLIDDFLTSGSAYENVTASLKGLLDVRIREGRTTIITTQLHARDISGDSNKFGNETKADKERINAIIRRLRGEFSMIDFDAGLGDGRF